MTSFKLLLGLALAGAAGTLARYGLSLAIDRKYAHGYFGTLAANAIGCLLFGLILAYFAARFTDPAHPARIILLTGFMGAFTTFSTYAYLSATLIDKHQWLAAAGNILAHNALGITLFIAGAAIGGKLAG